MHSFTTERLLIRPLTKQDRELYISLYCDAKVMRNIAAPLSIGSARKAFDNTLKAMQTLPCKVLTWVIVKKFSNQAIGIQAFNFNDKTNDKSAEIGIMLSTKEQNTGLGKEAVSALLHYGFSRCVLDMVTVLYAKKNLASDKLFSSLNFILAASPTSISNNTEEMYSIQKRLLYKKTNLLC